MNALERFQREFDRSASVRRFQGARCIVLRDLSTALQSGADLSTTLIESGRRCENRHEKLFYSDVASKISSGRKLEQAMGAWFKPAERMLLEAFLQNARTNEAIGEAFEKIVQVIEPFDTMQKETRKFIVVCSLIALACVGAIAFTSTALVQLAKVIPQDRWPGAIRASYGAAQFLVSYGVFLLPLLVALPFVARWLLATWQGPLRRRWDKKVPGFSIYRQVHGAFTMISLGAYASTGRGIGESCRSITPTATPWLRAYLGLIIARSAKKGADIVDVGLFDWRVMVRLVSLTNGQSLPAALAAVGLQASTTIATEVTGSLKRAQFGAVTLLSVVLVLCIVSVGTLYFALLASTKSLH